MSSFLVPGGAFDAKGIGARFRAESAEIDQEIAGFVIGKLGEYPGPGGARPAAACAPG